MKIINPMKYQQNNTLTSNPDLEFLIIPKYTQEKYQAFTDRIIKCLPPLDSSTYDYVKYTLEHKIAIMALSYEYLGYISKRIMLHDIEKLVLYAIMDKKEASKLHRATSIHHQNNFHLYEGKQAYNNRKESVLDYECARYTKSDKPLNAYSTIQKYYFEDYEKSKYILDEFSINSSENHDCMFERWDLVANIYMPIFEEVVTETVTAMLNLFKDNNIESHLKNFNQYLLEYDI